MPFERGRTLLVKGRVHRRRKEKRLADEALREARAIFADCGAPLWTEMATTELNRIGLRPRAPHDLTETERRVAILAASGMTNREVAQAAFLSPKTIDNVLGRVYRKLGIGSRAELGAIMATEERGASEVVSAT
jgi:DNA-binding CsgD family transcriptional regulator